MTKAALTPSGRFPRASGNGSGKARPRRRWRACGRVLEVGAGLALLAIFGCSWFPAGGGGGGGSAPAIGGSPAPTGSQLAAIPVGPDPRGLALDPSGRVWVAVHDAGTVVEIAGGEASRSIAVPDPDALAFDASGDLWVGTDSGIRGFSASGVPLGSVADPAVEGIAVASGSVYASLPSIGAVRAYAINGTTLGSGVTLISGGGTPHDLLVDRAGRLWVADGEANRVARYDQPDQSSVAPELRWCGFDAEGLAMDASGSVYALGNSTIAEVSASPSVSIAQDSRMAGAVRMAADDQGRFWVAARTINQVALVQATGSVSTLATSVFTPFDVLRDASGSVWVSSEGSGQVDEFSGT